MNTGKSGRRHALVARSPAARSPARPGAAAPRPLANPVQSCAPSAPGTGTDPSPARRTGTRPVVNWPIRCRSATSRFCTGAAISAAARPASATLPARFSASSPAAASPGRRFAIAAASTEPSAAAPQAPGRSAPARAASPAPATPRPARLAPGCAPRGPRTAADRPAWHSARPAATVSTNTSCVSAPVVVNVHAIRPLCPITRNGTPGAVAPASTPARRVDPRQIPDARHRERQMRIPGQQRRAGRAVRPVHRPLVAGRVRQGERRRERRHGARPSRRPAPARDWPPAPAPRPAAARAPWTRRPGCCRSSAARAAPTASCPTGTAPSSCPTAGCPPATMAPAARTARTLAPRTARARPIQAFTPRA